jgi:uracil-DNA glycosylase
VFTGDGAGGSSDFLMRAMHAAGFASMPISRHPHDGLRLLDAYIAAAVRCAPPDNKPTPEEISRVRFISRQLAELLNIRVVVALGKIAFDAYGDGGKVPVDHDQHSVMG